MVDHPRIMENKGETYHHLQYKNNFLPFSLEVAYEDLSKALDKFEKAIEADLSLHQNFSAIHQAIINGIGFGFLEECVIKSIDEMIKSRE